MVEEAAHVADHVHQHPLVGPPAPAVVAAAAAGGGDPSAIRTATVDGGKRWMVMGAVFNGLRHLRLRGYDRGSRGKLWSLGSDSPPEPRPGGRMHRVPAAMLETLLAGQILRFGYRLRSLATNERQFRGAVTAIEELIAATPEPILRGRRPVPSLPGLTPVMRGWSAFMTIDHCNGVHEAMLQLIPELEAGRSPEIGDIGRFDHPPETGPEVMPRFRDLAARVADLPRSIPFTGRGTFQHPIFGRLDSRGAYALLAFHLRLHVPQIRRSIEINGRP